MTTSFECQKTRRDDSASACEVGDHAPDGECRGESDLDRHPADQPTENGSDQDAGRNAPPAPTFFVFLSHDLVCRRLTRLCFYCGHPTAATVESNMAQVSDVRHYYN